MEQWSDLALMKENISKKPQGYLQAKKMHNTIEFHIEDADNEPQNRVNGRRGTLEDILD